MRARPLLLLSLVTSFALAQSPAPPPKPTDAAAKDAASHDLGLIFGNQLRNGGLESEVSLDALMRGIQDGLEGKPVTSQVKAHVSAVLRTGHELLGNRNKELAREFLAKNSSGEGVTTTASGLQYQVLSAGNANAGLAGPKDEVSVNYRGALLDGTEFDSSYLRGQPTTFRVDAVIKGWQEALVLMKPGAKWRLFVPPELAYDTQPPPNIPPGSMLVFDLELLKVGPATKTAP